MINKIKRYKANKNFITCLVLVGFSLLIATSNLKAQIFQPEKSTYADSLKGFLSKARLATDVYYYDLDLKLDPKEKSIEGTVDAYLTLLDMVDNIQFDLSNLLTITEVNFNGKKTSFTRENDAVFIKLPQSLLKNSKHNVSITYHGNPKVALRAPWDGGFVFEKDKEGNPRVAVACQGEGASLWWPLKDHVSDEPDSLQFSLSVPNDLQNVSNGQLRTITKVDDQYHRFTYFVSYPINTYNVTFNVGKFEHFSGTYETIKGNNLKLDYYVYPENLKKAKKHFKQVKPMLTCFENLFGEYPFEKDGFKLIETPYLGMEHQSAVAYGNKYQQGYLGGSHSPHGMKFDFIIIHESGHEWWGNKLSTDDVADLWIHEAFTTYSEVLYVGCQFGEKAADEYANTQKKNIKNDTPIRGQVGLHREGSSDMYNKGSVVLHMLSKVYGDEQWLQAVKNLQNQFAYKTLNYDDVVVSLNKSLNTNVEPIFEQYIKSTNLPTLEYGLQFGKSTLLKYKWSNAVDNFNLPIKLRIKGKLITLNPTSKIQYLKLDNEVKIHQLIFDDFNYIFLKKINTNL